MNSFIATITLLITILSISSLEAQSIIFENKNEISQTLESNHSPYPYDYMQITYHDSTSTFYVAVRNDQKLQGFVLDNQSGALIDSTNTISWERGDQLVSFIDASRFGALLTDFERSYFWHFDRSELVNLGSDVTNPRISNKYLAYNIEDFPFNGSSVLHIENLTTDTVTEDVFSSSQPLIIEGYGENAPFLYQREFSRIINRKNNTVVHRAATGNIHLRSLCNDSLLLIGEDDRLTIINHKTGAKEVLFGFTKTDYPQIPIFSKDGLIQSITSRESHPEMRYYDQSLNLIKSDRLDSEDIYTNTFLHPSNEVITLATLTGRTRVSYDLRYESWYSPISFSYNPSFDYPYVDDNYIYDRLDDSTFLKWMRGSNLHDTIRVEPSTDQRMNSQLHQLDLPLVVWQGENKGRFSLTPEGDKVQHIMTINDPFVGLVTTLPNQVVYSSNRDLLGRGDNDINYTSTSVNGISVTAQADKYLIWIDGTTLNRADLETDETTFVDVSGYIYKGTSHDGNVYLISSASLYVYTGDTILPVKAGNGLSLHPAGDLITDINNSFYSIGATLYRLEKDLGERLTEAGFGLFNQQNGCGIRDDGSLLDYQSGNLIRAEATGRYDNDHCLFSRRDSIYKYPIGNVDASEFHELGNWFYRYPDRIVVDSKGEIHFITRQEPYPYDVNLFNNRHDHLYYVRGDVGFRRLIHHNLLMDTEIDVSPFARLDYQVVEQSGTGPHQASTSVTVDSLLFFVATSEQHGRELWYADGTADGTQILIDPTGDSFSSDPTDLRYDRRRNTLYWSARTEEGHAIYSYQVALPTQVEDQVSYDQKLVIAPNPTQDVLQIDTKLDIKMIQIYDQQGRQAASYTGNQHTIHVGDLSSGWYTVRILTTRNEIIAEDFVKM